MTTTTSVEREEASAAERQARGIAHKVMKMRQLSPPENDAIASWVAAARKSAIMGEREAVLP